MDYEKIDTTKPTVSGKSLALLVLSIIVFPLMVLLPFSIHAGRLTPVGAFSSHDGATPGCISDGGLVSHNQCAAWDMPYILWPLAMLLFATLASGGVLLNRYSSSLNRKEGKLFTHIRLISVLAVSAITLLSFAAMRGSSQNNGSYNFGLVSANVQGDQYVAASSTTFGYGLDPVMAVLLLAAYIVPAFLIWRRFNFSRLHVDGQKKKTLFQ